MKVKIKIDHEGKYHYDTSHYCKSSTQAGPYISSSQRLDTETEAM
ncbi:hypothetical protein [Salimicrobium jeotgali]|nr:hypothetical protein [Salimicrobium jeotgali]